MTITFTAPTAKDKAVFADCSPDFLNDRIKITAETEDGITAITFIKQDRVEKLGSAYIRSHLKIMQDGFWGDSYIQISENDFYNDLQRNPLKTIPLKFVGIECGTGREIYRGTEDGKYYLRESYAPRESFARWYVCGTKRHPDDGDEPRPNMVFQYNDQTEQVRYDDWNGVAAYADTFNPHFNP